MQLGILLTPICGVPIVTNRFTVPFISHSSIIYLAMRPPCDNATIDKLPWKAWKEYDYSTFYNKSPYEMKSIIIDYAIALRLCIAWGQSTFNETIKSLFDLYMNKWEENKRRQEDPDSGYVLKHENTLSDISEALQQ